jgi:hypothetical protein
VVDEETQKNNFDIVREVLKVTKEVSSSPSVISALKNSGERADRVGLPQYRVARISDGRTSK